MINLPIYPAVICIDEANRLCKCCEILMQEMLEAMESKPFYKRYVKGYQ